MVPYCSGYHVSLSRRRSRVRFPSGPFDKLNLLISGVGQVVKTSAFHAGIMGSIPIRRINSLKKGFKK